MVKSNTNQKLPAGALLIRQWGFVTYSELQNRSFNGVLCDVLMLYKSFIFHRKFNVQICPRRSKRLNQMSKSHVIIIGSVAGSLAAVAVVIGLVWFYKSHCKKLSNINSETGSSDPSAVVEINRGGGASSSAALPSLSEPPHGAVEFTMDELGQVTKQFNAINLIGHGNFGSVYKGLLRDGTLVAIKRRQHSPQQEFIEEVAYLSKITHRNLVTLLAYCQEKGNQVLVYEYISNGSVCNHLYGSGHDSATKLDFKQRLSIASGAANALRLLHSLTPPLPHNNFKTANVLVDENFTAKVADAGLSKLIEKVRDAGPSHATSINVFQDQVQEIRDDIYSFGIFLLELVTGRDATHIEALRSNESMIEWVKTCLTTNDFVDRRLLGSYTADGIRDLIRLTLQCLSFPERGRPKMEIVVYQLEQILEKEMALTTVMGDTTATVTLGSELFTS